MEGQDRNEAFCGHQMAFWTYQLSCGLAVKYSWPSIKANNVLIFGWSRNLLQVHSNLQKKVERGFPYTGLGKRVVPRLHESHLLTPSYRWARVHAT